MSAIIKHPLPFALLPSKPIYVSAIPRNLLISSHPPIPCPKILRKGLSTSPLQIVKCSSDNKQEDSASLKDGLSSMVGEQVDQLLNREENRGLFDELEKASMRVESAKRQLAEIEKQELEFRRFKDYITQLENRASEIAGCQREIVEARAKIEEAEQSLSESENRDGKREGIDNEERLESIRAASISAMVGTLAGLPIFLTQVTDISQLLLPVSIIFVSCALFGVTFRYTVRTDLDNIQLKTGTSAAFAFVKGLATLETGSRLELNTESILRHAFDGALYVSENLYIFICAAVALDYCFKMRLLSPFPNRRSSIS